MASNSRFAAKSLSHPLFLAALLVLVVNDHALKGAGLLPSWLTGKASDFAGLLVAPTVVAWCLRIRSRSAWLMVHMVIGVVFSALELVPWLCDLVEALSSPWFALRMVPDVSDLLALPMLVVSHEWLGQLLPNEDGRLGRVPARFGLSSKPLGVAALIACCASSRNPPVRVASDAEHLYAQKFSYQPFAILDGKSGTIQRIVKPFTPREPPLVFDGTLYFAGDGARPGLVALQISTGQTVYRALDQSPPQSLLEVDERFVYGMRFDGSDVRLMVIDRALGTLFGEMTLGSWADRVHVKSIGPGRIAVLADGEITVHAPIASEGKFMPPSGDEFLDFATDGEHLVASTDDGALVGFELSRPTVPSFVRLDAHVARGRSTMAIARGVLAYPTSEGAALAHAASGRAISNIPDAWLFSLDETGFYALAGSAILASELDGRTRWSVPASFEWPSSLAVTNDSVAIRDGDALLFGYDKRTGSPSFRFAFDAIPSAQ